MAQDTDWIIVQELDILDQIQQLPPLTLGMLSTSEMGFQGPNMNFGFTTVMEHFTIGSHGRPLLQHVSLPFISRSQIKIEIRFFLPFLLFFFFFFMVFFFPNFLLSLTLVKLDFASFQSFCSIFFNKNYKTFCFENKFWNCLIVRNI